MSRSALHRLLKRHGVSKRAPVEADKAKAFKADVLGFVHADVKYLPPMADENTRRSLFVAIDRTTRWVFVAVYAAKTAANASLFAALTKAATFSDDPHRQRQGVHRPLHDLR